MSVEAMPFLIKVFGSPDLCRLEGVILIIAIAGVLLFRLKMNKPTK